MRGYDVPVLVIRTWSRGRTPIYSRDKVERWLSYESTCHIGGRPPKFPQFLVPFDVVIKRKYDALEALSRKTPRLPRSENVNRVAV